MNNSGMTPISLLVLIDIRKYLDCNSITSVYYLFTLHYILHFITIHDFIFILSLFPTSNRSFQRDFSTVNPSLDILHFLNPSSRMVRLPRRYVFGTPVLHETWNPLVYFQSHELSICRSPTHYFLLRSFHHFLI